MLAVDRASGKILWTQTAATVTPHEGYHHLYGSFASNAPATDGRRVYAFFGSRGLFVYDLNGKLLWQKDLGIKMAMRLGFGEGTGVVVHEGRIYLQYDHQEPGAIVALNAADGKELWRAHRAENSSWSTPLVVDHNGAKQLVVTADTKVKAYDVDSGKVVWEVAGLGPNPIPQPVQFRDTVVFDAATGEPRYLQARPPKPASVKASPLVVNGRVYLATEEGDVVVVKAGPQFEVLATNTLTDQSFIASPIAIGNDLYLRSRTHLFRITTRNP